MHYSIGRLAELTGIPVKTIRFYSDEGVLPAPARTPAGYRRYGEEHRVRLELVRVLRELGVDLATIRSLGRRTLTDVLALQLRAVETQITGLQRTRAVLRATLDRAARDGADPAEDDLRRLHALAGWAPPSWPTCSARSSTTWAAASRPGAPGWTGCARPCCPNCRRSPPSRSSTPGWSWPACSPTRISGRACAGSARTSGPSRATCRPGSGPTPGPSPRCGRPSVPGSSPGRPRRRRCSNACSTSWGRRVRSCWPPSTGTTGGPSGSGSWSRSSGAGRGHLTRPARPARLTLPARPARPARQANSGGSSVRCGRPGRMAGNRHPPEAAGRVTGMRQLKSRFVPLAVFALAIFAAGCGEVNNTIDKAQACVESARIVKDLATKVTSLTDDPQAMDKALDDAATKLNDAADKAANTTLKQASEDLAKTLSGISVKDVNDAVDAAQKVGTDTAAYLEKVATACG
ncbi:MerR family transcriptional regulator [Nonomuraea sp. NN258]|nr:MerR family transcriptional regulator [Nonomuraea antri]